MASKLLASSFCLVSFLFTTSFCEESLIREVTDVQNPLVLKTTYTRIQPPSSYLMKIKSFSLLANSYQTERYESAVFEASGYKWRLVLYPNGNKNASGAGYISLYLSIQNSNFLSNNWEVYADVKFFVYNQAQDNFFTLHVYNRVDIRRRSLESGVSVQRLECPTPASNIWSIQCLTLLDTETNKTINLIYTVLSLQFDDSLKRFHVVNTEWGYSQVLSLATFNDANNGYLVNDNCAFGTEVYVTQPTKKWEEFYHIKPNMDEATFNWKIKNFSKLDSEFEFSQEFITGGIVWKLKVYPKGGGTGRGNWVSLFLIAYGYQNSVSRNETIYANYKLRVLNQRGTSHAEKEYTVAFLPPSYGWGHDQFVSLTDLQDTSKGFLVNDAMVVQSEIFKVSKTKYYP